MEATRVLARFVVQSRIEDIRAAVRHEAVRSLVNWLGCALGGSSHEAVCIALAALAPFSGPPQASVIGRCERLDILHAALVNGMSAHVFDFDDTHLRTLLHPSVPAASALFALAERRPLTGADFLHAFILGVEVECRIANAIYLSHNVNWYITGTAGVFGAAAAAGRALGLDQQKMTWAFGIAATQAAGLREMAGTMCKSFVHGRAAQNGLTAALLAAQGFTSSEQAIEAPRGFAHVLAIDPRIEEITYRLGEHYEIAFNTYKPYACGVVCHPVIDGCIQLRERHSLKPEQIAAVGLRVHTLALKLTGIRAPEAGLESKWSVYHSAAVAICDGAAGERQYADERVRDPAVKRLRERVTAVDDSSLREDEAHVAITLVDGRIIERHIEHVIGSVENPMSNQDLEDKFHGLADGVLPAAQIHALLEKCWMLATLSDVAEIARMAIPKSPSVPL
jgi:2-methylcitrate dehydratase PrpD